MKKYFLLLFILAFARSLEAQLTDTSCTIIANVQDTIFFCDTNASTLISIENTPNNVWQMGSTVKFGNLVFRDSLCAMITDSLNPYPTNNLSAFQFSLPERLPGDFFYNYYVKFWHRFDMDSLYDGGWLEFSTDTGQTWFKIDTQGVFFNNSFQNGYDACNLYGISNSSWMQSMDTLIDGTKAWTGNSQGWIRTALWLNIAFPIKKRWPNDPINAVRFVFKSDSVHNPKQGWSISEINTGWVWAPNEVEDISSHSKFSIYPNPSSDGRYEISYPSSIKNAFITVFDVLGRVVLSQPLSKKSIDLSEQTNGLYYYKIDAKASSDLGTLLKQ